MRRVFVLPVFVLLAVLFVGCGAGGGQGEDPAEEPELRVSATTSVLQDLAEQVGGERVEVTSIVPVGADAHTFQPSPRDAARISESSVVLENGLGLDDWVEDLVESAGNGDQTVIELSDGMQTLGEAHDHSHEGEVHEGEEHADHADERGADEHGADEHADEEGNEEHSHEGVSCHGEGDEFHCDGLPEGASCEVGEGGEITCEGLPEGASCHGTTEDFHCHGLEEEGQETHSDDEHSDDEHGDEHADEAGHEGHSHAEGNPHLWLDVENAEVYVEKIRDAFIEADPDGAEEYEANAEEYLAELDELDSYIEEQTQSIPEENRRLVTFHEAFPYFAEAYGFEEVAVILRNPDAEPSSREVAETVTQIEEQDVPAIFTEPQFNQGLADTIASEADVEVYELYSDTLLDDEEASSYDSMMRSNVDRLVEGLG